MCGFAGIVTWDERFPARPELLQRMADRIAHRGPDGRGIHISHDQPPTRAHPVCGMAHCRLAVIDPDPRADQPLVDGPSGRVLAYNGEIYNFRELRRELSALRPDYPWRTQCDTEVLLLAYDVWAERCVDHFVGMFAFALWDQPAGTLLLARDRMGQKPLYYAVAPDREQPSRVAAIAFASELAALRCLPWMDASMDPAALAGYLCWGYIAAPRTIYRGAAKLRPAARLLVEHSRCAEQRYFDPNQPPAGPSKVEGDGIAQTREHVTRAVASQLVADVPLGCFLSGGIDSSIIAAAMRASVPRDQRVQTFSIGFDDPRYDETQYAAAVAAHLGTEHQAFVVRPDAAADLPRLAAVFGEPLGDSSALPTHYLARQTRRHVKVALSGDGGDELFGGYDRYRAMWLGEGFAAMPQPLRRIAASSLWQRLPGVHPKSRLARAKRMLRTLEQAPPQRYGGYMRLFGDDLLHDLLHPDLRLDAVEQAAWLPDLFAQLSDGRDVVQAAMAVDRITYLPEDLLTKVDRCSMLHALEVRCPFMDHALVHFCAALSTAQLFGHPVSAGSFMNARADVSKRLLRRAFAADLPGQVFSRPKMGFALPIGQWLRTSLREMLSDLLLAGGSIISTHCDLAAVRRLMDDHQRQRADHSERLYALLMLELWRRQAC